MKTWNVVLLTTFEKAKHMDICRGPEEAQTIQTLHEKVSYLCQR